MQNCPDEAKKWSKRRINLVKSCPDKVGKGLYRENGLDKNCVGEELCTQRFVGTSLQRIVWSNEPTGEEPNNHMFANRAGTVFFIKETKYLHSSLSNRNF